MKRLIFGTSDFFAPVIFWSIFKMSKIKKWPDQKKLIKSKIRFFMPVNDAKEFLKYFNAEALFSQLFA